MTTPISFSPTSTEKNSDKYLFIRGGLEIIAKFLGLLND